MPFLSLLAITYFRAITSRSGFASVRKSGHGSESHSGMRWRSSAGAVLPGFGGRLGGRRKLASEKRRPSLANDQFVTSTTCTAGGCKVADLVSFGSYSVRVGP